MYHQTVCSCHVMYAFQSESTLYSWLNVKELLARSRHKIWSLSDSNWTWTHNHLVCKQTLNHLTKLGQMIELCCEYLSVWCIWLYVLDWLYFLYKPSGCGFESRRSHVSSTYNVFIISYNCRSFQEIFNLHVTKHIHKYCKVCNGVQWCRINSF